MTGVLTANLEPWDDEQSFIQAVRTMGYNKFTEVWGKTLEDINNLPVTTEQHEQLIELQQRIREVAKWPYPDHTLLNNLLDQWEALKNACL